MLPSLRHTVKISKPQCMFAEKPRVRPSEYLVMDESRLKFSEEQPNHVKTTFVSLFLLNVAAELYLLLQLIKICIRLCLFLCILMNKWMKMRKCVTKWKKNEETKLIKLVFICDLLFITKSLSTDGYKTSVEDSLDC